MAVLASYQPLLTALTDSLACCLLRCRGIKGGTWAHTQIGLLQEFDSRASPLNPPNRGKSPPRSHTTVAYNWRKKDVSHACTINIIILNNNEHIKWPIIILILFSHLATSKFQFISIHCVILFYFYNKRTVTKMHLQWLTSKLTKHHLNPLPPTPHHHLRMFTCVYYYFKLVITF